MSNSDQEFDGTLYDGPPDFTHSQSTNEDGDQDDLTGGVEDE